MNFRIIKTKEEYPDLLLHRDRDDTGVEKVVILTVGIEEDCKDCFFSETVCFEDKMSAQNFIIDYSKKSANSWCLNKEIRNE